MSSNETTAANQRHPVDAVLATPTQCPAKERRQNERQDLRRKSYGTLGYLLAIRRSIRDVQDKRLLAQMAAEFGLAYQESLDA